MSLSESMRRYWAENRELILERRRQNANYSSPERGRRIAERARERMADPVYRERQLASMRAGRNPVVLGLQVTLNGVWYPSVAAAMRATGLTRGQVQQLDVQCRRQVDSDRRNQAELAWLLGEAER